jgi:hypothetical protein
MRRSRPPASRFAAVRLVYRVRKLLRALDTHPTTRGVCVNELLQLHDGATLGVMLVVYSLVGMLPVAGIGNLTGIGLWYLAWHWWNGRQNFPLPDRIGQFALSAPRSRQLLGRLLAFYRGGARYLRPRWSGINAVQTRHVWSAWVAMQAAVIFLPVPLGNILPGISLMLLGVGQIIDDGLCMLLSVVVGIASLAYTLALWQGTMAALQVSGEFLDYLFGMASHWP